MIYYKNNEEINKCEIEFLEHDNGLVSLKLSLEKDSIYIEKSGDNYFDLLQEIRKELELEEIELLCNGTSLNVYPSAMQLDMGEGERAYRLKMGCHTQMSDIVETFEYDEANYKSCTVAEQIVFYERWILSKKKLKISYPKLSIDDISIGSELLFFWGHRRSKDGRISQSCFSQWWSCEFEKDGILYLSTEQWMMAEKARVFSDFKVLDNILKSSNPKEIKLLGRSISFYDEEVWSNRRYEIVKEGNYLKFSQNPELKDYLLSTGDCVIVEASPYDNIWGIGMKQDDEGIENPKNWKGKNLLGFALMEVRDKLK